MEGADGSDVAQIGDQFITAGSQYVLDDEDESLESEHTHEDVAPLREQVCLRDQDRFLPIANVARIMKKSIPKTGKIAKDAKECVQECVSEFISFITSEASERCHQEKRKTINGEDILFAMSTLGFDNYVEPLKVYLQKYRESTKGDKTMANELAEEYTEDYGATTTLTGNIMATEGTGQNVIYTYPGGQIPQQITFT